MPDDTDPSTCAECRTILCNWVHRGGEKCCYCADLDMEDMCEACADMMEVDDGP
jgi:hypothetical protein